MGFFRFRRSIKILPGVRWNFGKRSSSISLGSRGFHYTIGTHGTRTTVGLPGTGLSYTSTGSTKRQAVHPINIEKALKWGAKQHETFRFEVPDKEEGEQPATQKQIDSIRDLVQGIQGMDFDALGKKQAATIIDAIKAEKDRFTERKVQEYLAKQRKKPHIIAWGLVSLFLLAWISSKSSQEPVPAISVAITPLPRPTQIPIARVTVNVEPASVPSPIPSATPESTPSAAPLPTLASTPKPAVKVTLKTVKTIYPDSGGTKKIDPGTELRVIAVAGGVMTVELNGQTFNVSKSEIIERP